MNSRLKAIREVFGTADTFTIKPVTYGEINPVAEVETQKCGYCGSPLTLESNEEGWKACATCGGV